MDLTLSRTIDGTDIARPLAANDKHLFFVDNTKLFRTTRDREGPMEEIMDCGLGNPQSLYVSNNVLIVAKTEYCKEVA